MKEKFKKVFSNERFDPCRKDKNNGSTLHWRIVVAFFLPLNIIACIIAIYYFFLIDQGEFSINYTQSNLQTSAINIKELSGLVKYFEQRKDNLNSWTADRTKAVDPSL